MAEKAKEAGVTRFLFSSSCSLYGKAGDEMLDENAEFAPVTPYGRSKVLAERDISELADDTSARPTCATRRPSAPRRGLRVDVVVNNLVGYAAHHRRGPDSERRHAVAPAGARRGHRRRVPRRAARSARARPQRGVQRRREQRELPDPGAGRDRRGGQCRAARASFAEGGGPDKRSYRVDCSKIGAVLPDFQPRWTVRRGVEQLREAYVRNELTFDEFTGTRYLRINRVHELQEAGQLDDELRWRVPVGAG